MAKQLQLFYDKILEQENKKKVITKMLKEALENSLTYKKAFDEFVEAREKVKSTASIVKADFEKDLEELENINNEIKNDKECLSVEALNLIVASKPAIIEKDGKKYEPIFSVKYKLIK